jgi:peptide/nickel transport system permease protein
MLKKKKEGINAEEKFYIASQWQLMWRKFKKHKLAIFGGAILAIFYIVALFCEFFSPYDIYQRYPKHIYCPPQRLFCPWE